MKRIMLIGSLLFVIALGVWAIVQPASAQDGDDEDEELIKERLSHYVIRPVEDIVDTDLLVTNFASDGTASLSIETSVPVACTIVYGETEEFGTLSLDQDMAGGTHSVHNPLLNGLKPETTYYFRVQGFDDDGVLYISDVMTFTTPAFEEEATTNLASPDLGATVTGFSSAFGDATIDERWGAGMAFDDNPNTQWSSAGDGDEAWIEVELAQKARIHSVEFWSRAMNDGSSITLEFTIITEDGTVYGPFELPDADEAYEFEVEIEAQTLRFDLVNTTGGNTGVVNIAVYGEFLDE
ncbi:MAG: discoidin domain-containing protein [Chloroflexi bacterium]|nr:discoidin domain-containing protein [Chloroflexota bacterium]